MRVASYVEAQLIRAEALGGAAAAGIVNARRTELSLPTYTGPTDAASIKALILDDSDKDLLYTLATLYESLKDVHKHLEVMEKLLPKIDYPVRLVEKQAQNYRVLGKVDALAKLYRQAWEKTGNALFGEKLASFFEDQEMYNSLLDVLRKLAADNPDNLHYELQKARALILAGQPDSALTAYQALLKKSPDEREFLSPYATLLFEKATILEERLSREEDAKAAWKLCLELKPTEVVLLTQLEVPRVHLAVREGDVLAVFTRSELLAAREEATKANLAKDRFIAMLSHDLRTPLTAILGWARVFQERAVDERPAL